jgi:hypothetical protein
MSTPDRDPEFEAFLERRSLLPRALAEHENVEPPPEVDRSVLDNARAAVNATPPRKRFRSNRWSVPMALAATVLISLAIVVQVQRPARDALSASRVEERAVMPRQAFEPARAPLQTDTAEKPDPDIAALRDSPERFAKASAPAESRALIANEVRRAREQRADGFAADARADTPQSRRESMAAEEARARDDAAAESDRSARDSGATAAARSAADSVAAVEAENGKAATAPSAERDPKAWLERIAKLRAEGKHAQADREFKAFVKRYPDYVTDEPAR